MARSDLLRERRIAEMLLDDTHDLMRKATGWMLREAGKRDQKRPGTFLRHHYPRLPRTALRYAIERFGPPPRQKYLQRTFSIA